MTKPVTGQTTFGASTSGTTTQLDNNFLLAYDALNDFNTYKNYLVDSGAANAYAVTLPAGTTGALADGLQIQMKVTTTNTGASVLNFNGGGNANIVNPDGGALGANQLVANAIVPLQYSNANSAWVLQTPSGRTIEFTLGVLPAGSLSPYNHEATFSGDSGGTSSFTAFVIRNTSSGANAISAITGMNNVMDHAGSVNLTTGVSYVASPRLTANGNCTTLRAYTSNPTLSGNGNATAFTHYNAGSSTLSGNGIIVTQTGFLANDLGHASKVTNAYAFRANDHTASPTINTAFRGEMTAGATKYNLQMVGNANNVLAGPLYLAKETSVLQTAAALFAGSGAPNNSNGSNGDVYFRSDGGALTTIYQRRAGAWVGIV